MQSIAAKCVFGKNMLLYIRIILGKDRLRSFRISAAFPHHGHRLVDAVCFWSMTSSKLTTTLLDPREITCINWPNYHIFTLDFPEIRGYPLFSYLFRVRSTLHQHPQTQDTQAHQKHPQFPSLFLATATGWVTGRIKRGKRGGHLRPQTRQ